MKLLVADDDPLTRTLVNKMIRNWGYEVVEAENGAAALECLCSEDPPRIAVLDWMMPEMDGIEVSKKLARRKESPLIYTLLLTSKSEKEDIVEALDSGAHDFLSKPVNAGELKSRVRVAVGKRLIEAEMAQERLIGELKAALADIKILRGLLPICSYCKKVRDDKGYWNQIEGYIEEHSSAEFSHGICPDCIKEHFPEYEKK